MAELRSELVVTSVGERWRLCRTGTSEVLGEFGGRAEALQEARKIAQRETGTTVKLERANGSIEDVPLRGHDPLEEKG